MIMIRAGTAALVVVVLSTSNLTGQQHRHGQAPDTSAQATTQRGRMGMMRRGMMEGQGMAMMPAHDVMQRAMRLSPARLLAHTEALGLTAEQTAQLERLAARDSAAPQERMTAVMHAAEELARQFDAAKPDTAAVRAAAERLMALHGRLHAEQLATAAAVRGILSAAQLEKAMLLGHCDMQSMQEGMVLSRPRV
jgi:hypothetical protein